MIATVKVETAVGNWQIEVDAEDVVQALDKALAVVSAV